MGDSATLHPVHGDLFQNPEPFAPHPLLQIRAGRIQKLWGKGIESAIYKVPLSGPVPITPTGIATDQQSFHTHGGVDKALLHYCSRHYDTWKEELPQASQFCNAGAFGENLVSTEMDERTVCIGDKISIGNVLLEVTGSRAPCYKLNHRFEIKDMAKRAQTLFRVGWLYRVLKTGDLNVGDMIQLVERPHPEWTLARFMHYLYNEKDNVIRMKEIVQLPQLDDSFTRMIQSRLDKGYAEDQDGRMFGGEDERMSTWNEYRIVEKRQETSKVTAFVLDALDQERESTPVEPGSHVRLKLGGKLVRAYSVVGGTSKKFELGIALDPESRGGSKFLHEQTKVGDVLTVGNITASFPLAEQADRHIIIAGGIGITAFLAALEFLKSSNKAYELHFAVAAEVPYAKHIAALGANATIYNRFAGQKLDLAKVISRADVNTHIYCCGPQRLMDGVASTAKNFNVPDSSLHFEQFAVATSGDPFTAELKNSRKTVEVGGSQTLLDVLKEVGLDIDSSCEAGNCGTCRVNVCDGRIEHRGTGLVEAEKKTAMLSCVSRGIGHIVLDL
ncbi:3-chlorobenzoate-3,4-dioxygenase reductase subunit [Aaosphaeria arxii CBS 175.79]|uniref:3-chlorobenzoate-3,4-dioxygenase reductase subunit n=1 Tax=Aaosphaeria arxii CBS 175.79 TaxID=1450172 RepID=A0A6A5X9S5_9PLEO|nr:3-chlorobenzoate-3,4-dioxygenase reductase subunit [Aaosphaeria arxii CBS 175.79]KAF2009616.1 3-chlorobenzoate-3,4-dioxygenase reductase subunit [Aaosphaeria arxii CBS 175.79]